MTTASDKPAVAAKRAIRKPDPAKPSAAPVAAAQKPALQAAAPVPVEAAPINPAAAAPKAPVAQPAAKPAVPVEAAPINPAAAAPKTPVAQPAAGPAVPVKPAVIEPAAVEPAAAPARVEAAAPAPKMPAEPPAAAAPSRAPAVAATPHPVSPAPASAAAEPAAPVTTAPAAPSVPKPVSKPFQPLTFMVSHMTATPTFTGYEEIAAFGKANIDALIQANTVFTKGVEAISKEFIALTQAQLESNAAAAKAIFSAKTLKDVVELKAQFTKANFDKLVANSTKLGELGTKVATDTFAPISARVTSVVEKAAKPTA